jgi:hypothetical protein
MSDFVSPIIQAYLAGQKLKQGKVDAELRKQAAEDESKIRQQQAQKLAKEVARFDKVAEMEDETRKLQNSVQREHLRSALIKGVEEGTFKIPQKVIDAATLASGGVTSNEVTDLINGRQVMRAPEKINFGGQEFDTSAIPTHDEILATKVANRRALIQPEVEFAARKQAIEDTSRNQLLDKQFGQANINREDTQTFTSGENEKNRLARLEEAQLRERAQANEGRLNRASHWGIASMQQEGAKERAEMAIDAKNLTDSADVNAYVDDNVMNGLTTKERIAGLSKPMREAVYANAAKKHIAIHDEKQRSTLSDLSVLNKITDKVERLSKMIGNGAPVTSATGGLTELGKELKALEIYKPVLAKLTSVKGTQSDQDTKIAGGNLVETWGLGVAEENKRRLNALMEMQADLFLEQFPEGTNLDQIERAAKRYNINPKALKLVHERDAKRKAEGKK